MQLASSTRQTFWQQREQVVSRVPGVRVLFVGGQRSSRKKLISPGTEMQSPPYLL